MSQNKGRVTIPTNLDVVKETLDIVEDNAWAKANPDEIQQMYIMSSFHTATNEKLEIHLMDHLYPDMLKVNTRDDITRWWEVIDRTTGEVVPTDQWSYILSGIRFICIMQ